MFFNLKIEIGSWKNLQGWSHYWVIHLFVRVQLRSCTVCPQLWSCEKLTQQYLFFHSKLCFKLLFWTFCLFILNWKTLTWPIVHLWSHFEENSIIVYILSSMEFQTCGHTTEFFHVWTKVGNWRSFIKFIQYW